MIPFYILVVISICSMLALAYWFERVEDEHPFYNNRLDLLMITLWAVANTMMYGAWWAIQ